jgi:serine phosphatase RsbU (regulator of sigma subunit)
MLQSQIAALVHAMPDASPSQVVTTMNAVLRHNIRGRLRRDDHATLVVLRYLRSGRVCFAGSHDALIVCRAATGRAEIIDTHGVWVGALEDVGSRTSDSHFTLSDGDVLVLHTDGITEASNAHHEQFGLERLCASVESRFGRSSKEISEGVFADVNAWTTSQHDDMSLVVARYSAPR